MMRFRYKGKDSAGNMINGEVEAADLHVAVKLIHDKGLVTISIVPIGDNLLDFIKRLNSKISASQIATFTRQIATMVAAGLSITEALLIIRSQSEGSMQKIVAKILGDVEGGESLSTAMSKHPQAFSATYIALLKSGEAGGVMDEVLTRLADNMEKEQEFRGKIKGALIYPIIIVVGMVIVSFIMMVFVIPRMTSLYNDFNAKLPLPTLILISISNFFVKFWPVVLVTTFFAFWGFSAYRKTTIGRKKTDELVFKIPIVGALQREIVMTELTRTLSLMVGSGVSILESLNITASVVGNMVIADALKDAAKQVEKGFPVAYSFARHPDAFPFILSQMISVGEETGKMDEVLKKVSHVFEVEADQKVKALTASIEPIIMIILGVGVTFLVISIILPIYNLTTSI